MSLQYFIMLCGVNLVSLVVVSMLILYSLRKCGALSQEESMCKMKQQEEKLQSVLTEISSVATLLYDDIAEKEKELKDLLKDVHTNFEVLCKLKAGTAQVINSASAQETSTERCEVRTQERPARPQEEHINQRIYTLRDQGYGIVEIARMVDKPQGEVELILNLRSVRK